LLSADNPKTLSDALELLKSAPYPMNKRFPDLLFEFGQSQLTDASTKLLQELFILLAKNRDYIIEISGHHDSSELDSLAQGRINRVASYLNKKGIANTRIIEKLEGNLKSASKTDKTKNSRVSLKFYSQSMEDVVKRFNAIKPLSLTAEEGFFKRGENAILDSIPWEIGKKNFDRAGRYYFMDVKNIEKERLKTFSEARSSVIRNLQSDLEQKWILNLKQRFPIIRQEEELNKIMQ
jgi:peptidyl-prolyl cis-trans isomerase SurA